MAHPPELKRAVRNSYVTDKVSLEHAAQRHNVPLSTIKAWKRKDKSDGNDWDKQRAATRIGNSGIETLTAEMIEDFVPLFMSTIDELREGQLPALQKAEVIGRLTDSYVKLTAGIARSSPQLQKLSFALEIIKQLVDYTQNNMPQCAAPLLEVLEPFGEHVAALYG